jgi:hypothetical protein
VQHAEVTISDDGISGYQTWEFYSKRWRRNKAEKFHICARVQALEGTLVEPMQGCQDCDAVYEISLAELETDCEYEVGTKKSFSAVSHFGLGPLSGELDEQNTHDEAELGWFISWDSQLLEPMGYAWTVEGEDEGGDTGVSETVESMVFWPGYAWKL